MPSFRIYQLKQALREPFRWQPHTSDAATLRQKDYDYTDIAEAATPYAVWTMLRGTDSELQPGDALEAEDGTLLICKYIGFEAAQWLAPEQKLLIPNPLPPPASVDGVAAS